MSAARPPVRGSRQHQRVPPRRAAEPSRHRASTGPGARSTDAARRRSAATSKTPSGKAPSGKASSTKAANRKAPSGKAPRLAPDNAPLARRTVRHQPPPVRRAEPRDTSLRSGRPLQKRTIRTVRHSRVQFRPGNPRRRLRVLFVCVAVLLAVGFGWLVWLQTARVDELRTAGRQQSTSATVVKARRGTIFDRDGADLALSVPSRTIFADPRLITDPQATLDVLAPMLDLGAERRETLETALADRSKAFVYIARQVDDETAANVTTLELPGIGAYTEDQRILPAGDVASAVIGRTDIDGVGTSGLEKVYDDLLRGVDGTRTRQHDREGNSIVGGVTTQLSVPGDDLVLTIDRSLQFQVEQALLQRVVDTKAMGGSVVVLDSATGEVLAMANVDRGDEGPEVTWANRSVVNTAEPGSVAKIFSIAATVDQGATNPDVVMTVPDTYVFDAGTKWQFRIHDAEAHGTIPMSVRDILVHSSNIGTLLTAGQIPITTLHDYLASFGFGSKPGLGIDDEAKGALRPAEEWQGSEKATVTYGYGYSASPLQLAAAANTIANDGVYVAPKLVQARIDADGTRHDTEDSEAHQVVSAETALTMRDMMTSVVCSDAGTGNRARLEGMLVAGKTGTSRKVQSNGTYVNDDGTMSYVANFVGMLPAAQPEVTIMVQIDEPDPTSRDRFGGTAAAPLFATVAEAAIHDRAIMPPPGDVGCAT